MERAFRFSNGSCFAFLVFLLISPLGLAFPSLVDEASTYNLGLADSLWHHRGNFAGVQENSPSVSDPVYFASASVVAGIPEVGDRISSGENTRFLFAWEEGHAQRVEERIPGGECPDGRVVLEESEEPQASLDSVFILEGKRRERGLESALAEIPFSAQELESAAANASLEGRNARLDVEVSGKISFPYSRREEGYRQECIREDCSCEFYSQESSVSFEKEVRDGSSFLVDGAGSEIFISRPASLENDIGRNVLEVFVFSQGKFRGLSANVSGNLPVEKEFAGLEGFSDSFGALHLAELNISLGDDAITHVQGRNNAPSGSPFLHAYRIRKTLEFGIGKNNVSFVGENLFGRERKFNFSITTREKTVSISEDGDAKLYGLGGEELESGDGLSLQGFHSDAGEDSIVSVSFPGSLEYYPSGETVFEKKGMFFEGDFAMAVFLALAIGAGVWIARRAWQ